MRAYDLQLQTQPGNLRALLFGRCSELDYQFSGYPAAVFDVDALCFGPLADFQEDVPSATRTKPTGSYYAGRCGRQRNDRVDAYLRSEKERCQPLPMGSRNSSLLPYGSSV